MTTYIIILFIIAAVSLAFSYGYRRGKDSRKIDLAGLDAQHAFAYFLLREKSRHWEDIDQIECDLQTLRDNGVISPDIPLDMWIEVQ